VRDRFFGFFWVFFGFLDANYDGLKSSAICRHLPPLGLITCTCFLEISCLGWRRTFSSWAMAKKFPPVVAQAER
jgi:hypothetical protein